MHTWRFCSSFNNCYCRLFTFLLLLFVHLDKSRLVYALFVELLLVKPLALLLIMRCVYIILELCLDCKLITPCFGLITVFWSNRAELDYLEADMGLETESDSVPSYLQPDKEPDYDAELNLPSAPTGQTAMHAGRAHGQVNFILLFSIK